MKNDKDMSRWIIKQMFYLRPVPKEFSVSIGYGVKGSSWSRHINGKGLWVAGQKEGMGQHPGTDFDAPEGTLVVSMANGYIGKAGWENPQAKEQGYGLRIRQTISLSKWCLVYGHLSHLFVKPGAWVERGDPIAQTGRTGNASRPHLHCHLENPDGQYHELSFDEES